jgi:hypothetical protein
MSRFESQRITHGEQEAGEKFTATRIETKKLPKRADTSCTKTASSSQTDIEVKIDSAMRPEKSFSVHAIAKWDSRARAVKSVKSARRDE